MMFRHIFLVIALLASSQLYAGNLTVELAGVRSDRGDIWVIIYDNPNTFAWEKHDAAAFLVKIPARKGNQSFTLNHVAEGHYAVSVWHDENTNGNFDMMGIFPLEGFAYSNNVGHENTPTFQMAAIAVGKEDLATKIRLIYY